jgi:16S rRNA processing protein RimM
LSTEPLERLIPLAEVARPHGIQGELRLKLYNRDSTLLEGVEKVVLHPEGEEPVVANVSKIRRNNHALLITIEGCSSREAADELRGAQILIPRDWFPPLADGEYYICDIENAEVVDAEGRVMGKVHEVITYPTCEALVVRHEGEEFEVPMVDGMVGEVDVQNHRIVVLSTILQ